MDLKLSVIMPCYNVQDTLGRALDSVIMQKVSFQYEIILVNDASTDLTLTVAKDYQARYANSPDFQIIILNNPENCGNAKTFYNGLSHARGDFFCVLDGDDYYTINNKLQRQINFFDKDLDCEYVATAHYHVIDTCDGKVHIGPCPSDVDLNYSKFVSGTAGYYHTATYMYRNIFKGHVPEYYSEIIYRGDTPRTTFHLLYSNKKIHILNFVGSAYCYTNNGIWSKLKVAEQFDYQIRYLSHHRTVVRSDYEKRQLDNSLSFYKKKRSESDTNLSNQRNYISIDYNASMERLRQYARLYTYRERSYVSNGLYYSDFLDSLAASIGYIYRVYHQEYIQRDANTDNVCIVTRTFDDNNCRDAYDQITRLFSVYKDKTVYLLVVDVSKLSAFSVSFLELYDNVRVVTLPLNCPDKLQWLYSQYKEISPFRTYYSICHDDVYGSALVQPGPCENIGLFNVDRGFLFGLTNPFFDKVIATRPVDYELLKKKLGEKTLYIPQWAAEEANEYIPFRDHCKLITASYASTFDHLNGAMPYSYIELVLETLALTGGRHYHYGSLSEEVVKYITDYLKGIGLPQDSFICIENADCLAQDCLNRGVDIFIESFPCVEPQASLSVMSAGIPIFVHAGLTRLGVSDFVYKNCLKWSLSNEFAATLRRMTPETLSEQSAMALKYIQEQHNMESLLPCIRESRSFSEPEYVYFTDDSIPDILDHLIIFKPLGKISFMAEEERRLADLAQQQANKEKELEEQEKARAEKLRILTALEEKKKRDDAILKSQEEIKQIIKRQMQKRQVLEARNKWARNEITKVRGSLSYKVGSTLLFLPKQAKKLVVKKSYSDKLGRVMSKKEYDEYANKNIPLEQLKDLTSSHTYRVGLLVTWPVRKVYRLVKRFS